MLSLVEHENIYNLRAWPKYRKRLIHIYNSTHRHHKNQLYGSHCVPSKCMKLYVGYTCHLFTLNVRLTSSNANNLGRRKRPFLHCQLSEVYFKILTVHSYRRCKYLPKHIIIIILPILAQTIYLRFYLIYVFYFVTESLTVLGCCLC